MLDPVKRSSIKQNIAHRPAAERRDERERTGADEIHILFSGFNQSRISEGQNRQKFDDADDVIHSFLGGRTANNDYALRKYPNQKEKAWIIKPSPKKSKLKNSLLSVRLYQSTRQARSAL